MSITLSVFLYVYAAIFFVYIIFSMFNFYHLFKFALNQYVAYMGTAVYVFGIVLILGVSFFFMSGVSWGAEIVLFDYPSKKYIQSPF